jgi:hypothetical protein
MSAHTPGPWKIAPKDTNRRVVDSTGHSVAVASRLLPLDRKAESWANARLIAAAPELLALAHKADRLLGASSNPEAREIAAMARSAIARAGQ